MSRQKRVVTTDLFRLQDLVAAVAKQAQSSSQTDVNRELQNAFNSIGHAIMFTSVVEAKEKYQQEREAERVEAGRDGLEGT